MLATVSTPRCLLGVADLSPREFEALLDLAAVMKRHPLAWRSALAGRAVACVFEHSGLRSQVSLEVAVHRLGALPVVLQPRASPPWTPRTRSRRSATRSLCAPTGTGTCSISSSRHRCR